MNYETKVAITLLLKGLFYKSDNENAWLEMLERSRGAMSDYFEVIGLSLEVDEVEGYAYLKTIEQEEEAKPLPKLSVGADRWVSSIAEEIPRDQ